MHRFSIVIPAYNAEATLAETLDAVLSQTMAEFECVVVNDGSLDATGAVATSFAGRDDRIKVITQPNAGTGGAYNTGVTATTGEFVVLCSADDVLLPECLARMSDFIDHEPDYDIYSANGYFWRPGVSRDLVYPPGTRDAVMSLSLADVIRLCFYGVGATYRRVWFDAAGGYREDVFGEDYDFWLRAMALGARHRYLPSALSLHRVSPTQKSASLERAYRSDIRLVTDLRDNFSLSLDELSAVDECVQARESLIAQIGGSKRTALARDLTGRALPGDRWSGGARAFAEWCRRHGIRGPRGGE